MDLICERDQWVVINSVVKKQAHLAAFRPKALNCVS